MTNQVVIQNKTLLILGALVSISPNEQSINQHTNHLLNSMFVPLSQGPLNNYNETYFSLISYKKTLSSYLGF